MKKRQEIAMMKLADPDLTLNEIVAKTDIPKTTVANILVEEVGKIRTNEKSIELYNANIEILRIGAEKMRILMRDASPIDIREGKDYQSILDVALKQNRLLDDKSTENVALAILTDEDKIGLLGIIGK